MKKKYEKFNLATNLGLSAFEYDKILRLLNRVPSTTEIGIFSAMWSEHCSYKTSRYWLKKLPTSAPWVIQGPGENAGIIDIGENNAIAFKIESHNHPSFIEPYQGSATGLGGIMRDIFTMGARPIANLNCLRFGSPEHYKTKHLLKGVVSGIGDYGNCVGIPTVGGECSFDKRYDNNILVNAMSVGSVKRDKIFYARSGKVGNSIIYVGAKTGRDGIHGASMSSESFKTDSEKLKPTVQVGCPFTEKLLLEACLELMEDNSIVGIQDMGAAGLTSSAIEMAANDNLGIELNLDLIPIRDDKMSALEIMLSESQERMLIVLKPGNEKKAYEIFNKWELNVAKIGHITNTKSIKLFFKNDKVADLPINPLAEGIAYIRPHIHNKITTIKHPKSKLSIKAIINKIINNPNYSSRHWIWEQYDHMITQNVISPQGGNASVIKIKGSNKSIAITTDCNINYCHANAYLGSMQAVAESYRNLISVGATPLAITNCLNFGNPEKHEIMGQFTDTIKGIKEASVKLHMPVVSGNVSFYNETNGINIPPTPQIGSVGLIDRSELQISHIAKPNDILYLIGDTKGHMSCTVYEEVTTQGESLLEFSTPPPVNLLEEYKIGKFINILIKRKVISSCHDVSDGGIMLSIVEICMASNMGCDISKISSKHNFLFSEDQARYIISISANSNKYFINLIKNKGIPYTKLGFINDKNEKCYLKLPDKTSISINNLQLKHKMWFNNYIG